MNDQPADMGAAPAKKAAISKIGFAIGAATALYAVTRIVWALLKLPLAAFTAIPFAAAGIALIVRSLRGPLPWPRALATWAGGFLVGIPGLLLTPILSGPGDTTFWVLNFLVTGLGLAIGSFLLRIGSKP
jgi:hypothetical protein